MSGGVLVSDMGKLCHIFVVCGKKWSKKCVIGVARVGLVAWPDRLGQSITVQPAITLSAIIS